MKHDLKNSVKDFVASKQLSNEQLNSLMSLVGEHAEVTAPKRNRVVLRVAAAMAVITIAAGLLWNVGLNKQTQVSLLVAEEVVQNHLKMKPLEVTGHSMQDIRAYFNQLDFSLRDSSLIAASNLQLLGGRYCSIQGFTAAQLRMKHKETADLETLYQAPYDSELFKDLPNLQEGQSPKRHYINGIGVDVWVDKGILFARTFSDDS